jgi:hypothetical protein
MKRKLLLIICLLLMAFPVWAIPPSSSSSGSSTVRDADADTAADAANALTGVSALPDGVTATTQSAADNSTKVATTAYVDTGLGGKLSQSSGLDSARPGTCTAPQTYFATDTKTYYFCTAINEWHPAFAKGADGSYRYTFSNNTAIDPTASAYEAYFEGGVFKINEGGVERTPVKTSDVIKLAVFNFPGDAADGTVTDSYQPFAATITGWVITNSGAACSAVVDIWAQAYADFPPENAQSIAASALPTLSTAQMNEDTTLTGWTTAVTARSFLRANLDSSDCTGTIQVTIYGTR